MFDDSSENLLSEETIRNFISAELKGNYNSTNQFVMNSIYDNSKNKLYISPEKGKFIDFHSGEKGSFIRFAKDYLGLKNTDEAIEYIILNYCSLEDFGLKKEIQEEKKVEVDFVADFINTNNPKWFKNMKKSDLGFFGRKAYNYILGRRLDPYYARKIGYVYGEGKQFSERVIIPFFQNGSMNYFLGRSLNPKEKRRYLNPPNSNSKKVLFNYDEIQEGDDLIIAEGTFDAMSINHDDQIATSLLGADISIFQLEKIYSKKVKNIIYAPDTDEAGQRVMKSNIKKLITYCPYEGLNVYIYDIPSGYKDLNELKVGTGKDFILKKECRKYGELYFDNEWINKLF